MTSIMMIQAVRNRRWLSVTICKEECSVTVIICTIFMTLYLWLLCKYLQEDVSHPYGFDKSNNKTNIISNAQENANAAVILQEI